VSYGDDLDNMSPLFGSTAYDGSPFCLDPDDMYKISSETPLFDESTPSSPIHFDDPSAFPTRQESAQTGTRKNITPESLVPYDAPIQPRKYSILSTSSRKELPATFARKRGQTSEPAETAAAVGPTLSEEDPIEAKRLQNTLAARQSRKRKLEYLREVEDARDAERKDKEMWRARAIALEALLRDKGHEVPSM
jgi:hypothetical protein